MTGIQKWSKTSSSNGTADTSINFAEGQAPSSLNDSNRAVMARIAEWRDDISGTLTTGGTSTAFTLTSNRAFASASDMSGSLICFIPNADSGASPTLAVDGLTARAINYSTGVAIPTGALKTGTPYLVTYIHASTEFILVGALAVGNASITLTNLNLDGGTALTAPDKADEAAVYDASATANRKITLENLWKVVNTFTAETAPAVDDVIGLYDTSATAIRAMTLANVLTVVNGLTEDTSPDSSNDFLLTYDASATAVKKVKPTNMQAKLLPYAQWRDEKSSGTAAGTFTSGAWRTRTLNTETTNTISGASLATNQFTLPAGTYFIDAWAIANSCEVNKLKLRNTSDSADTLIGASVRNDSGANVCSPANVSGRFTIAGSKTFELQHQCATTRSTDGFGVAASFSVVEVYADAKIWKLA